MKKITIDFKSEKFEEELQKLEKLEERSKNVHISHTGKHSIELFINGDLESVFIYYLEDGINLNIYSEDTYYDKEERIIKHTNEEIRINRIRNCIIW